MGDKRGTLEILCSRKLSEKSKLNSLNLQVESIPVVLPLLTSPEGLKFPSVPDPDSSGGNRGKNIILTYNLKVHKTVTRLLGNPLNDSIKAQWISCANNPELEAKTASVICLFKAMMFSEVSGIC